MSSASHKNRAELQEIIEKAVKKVQGSGENDLCKYLPGPSGGYMHHFTLRKLKHANPEELFLLLQKFVVESEAPKILHPKPRAPRGSRKGRDFVSFTRSDLEKVLDLARKTGDKELLARFSPKRSLPVIKKELIRSIRDGRVVPDLWNAYAELLQGSITE